MLIAHLALEAPEHFGGDDVDALFGADIALAKWEDPRATDPAFLAACVLRASGLDEAERRAADARLTGTRAKKANPVDRAFSAARGRAASMFNLVLSALDMRRAGAPPRSRRVRGNAERASRAGRRQPRAPRARRRPRRRRRRRRRASGRRAPRRRAGGKSREHDTDTLTRDASPSANAINLNAASLRVVREDAHVVAVSKPAGVLTTSRRSAKKARDGDAARQRWRARTAPAA